MVLFQSNSLLPATFSVSNKRHDIKRALAAFIYSGGEKIGSGKFDKKESS